MTTLFLTRDAEFAELPRHEAITELLPHRVGNQHLGVEIFVQRFQARREVYGVADIMLDGMTQGTLLGQDVQASYCSA